MSGVEIEVISGWIPALMEAVGEIWTGSAIVREIRQRTCHIVLNWSYLAMKPYRWSMHT